jgi:hypothetical protein
MSISKLLLPLMLLSLLACSNSNPAGVGSNYGAENYKSEITATLNEMNRANITVSGNGNNYTKSINLDFNSFNSVQLTMISAYIGSASNLKVELWSGDTHLFTEDIAVSGSLTRSLAIKTDDMPTRIVISTTNFLGSVEMTLQAYSS